MSANNNRQRPRRVWLYFSAPGVPTQRVRVPLDVDAHTLVLMARGKFLPPDVLPTRLMRDGKVAPYFDPLAPLADGGTQDGDVLVCESDTGQSIEEPSLLGAYRAMSRYAARALTARQTPTGVSHRRL